MGIGRKNSETEVQEKGKKNLVDFEYFAKGSLCFGRRARALAYEVLYTNASPITQPTTMKLNEILTIRSVLAAALALISSSALAVPLAGPVGTTVVDPSGIRLTLDSFSSSGTGVITPFLRLQANDTETAFNTGSDSAPGDYLQSFTDDLSFSSLQIVQLGGLDFYQFALDINQVQANDATASIELTVFELYRTDTANRTSLSGTPLISLTDDYLILGNNSGSGAGDVQFFVPIAALDAGVGSFVTLNVTFVGSNNGFEEFAAVQGPNPPRTVPDNGMTIALLGVSMVGIEIFRRRMSLNGSLSV